ncbi:hypothetical protein HaLaN_11813, partial [Haematococcus lacustris]
MPKDGGRSQMLDTVTVHRSVIMSIEKELWKSLSLNSNASLETSQTTRSTALSSTMSRKENRREKAAPGKAPAVPREQWKTEQRQ